ncbi:hypothetical protein Csa_018484, partial [Cucumis sativus]
MQFTDEREAVETREREKAATQKHIERLFFCKRSRPTRREEDVGVLTSASWQDGASFSGMYGV